jgi:hypothetical protein
MADLGYLSTSLPDMHEMRDSKNRGMYRLAMFSRNRLGIDSWGRFRLSSGFGRCEIFLKPRSGAISVAQRVSVGIARHPAARRKPRSGDMEDDEMSPLRGSGRNGDSLPIPTLTRWAT